MAAQLFGKYGMDRLRLLDCSLLCVATIIAMCFSDDKEFLSVMACFSAQLCRAIVLGGMDRIVAILGLHCL